MDQAVTLCGQGLGVHGLGLYIRDRNFSTFLSNKQERPSNRSYTMKIVDKITDNIYVGSMHTLEHLDGLQAHNIRGVISVMSSDVPDLVEAGFKHLQIQIDDEESENIVQHFGKTNQFIESVVNEKDDESAEEGKKPPGVLVHCAAGVSRSVSVVMAYLLYKAHINGQELTVEDALEAVKAHRPSAGPNDGFMEQLQVYKDCDFEISGNKIYRQWLLRKQAENSSYTGQAPTITQFGSASAAGIQAQLRTPQQHRQQQQQQQSPALSQLRCKKCRTPLAASPGFISHTPGEQPQQSQYRSRHSSSSSGTPNGAPRNGLLASASLPPQCMQYFMEPVVWMKPELDKGLLEGKFECPKCAAKVGSYSWRGGKCSCGTWVTPAIEIQRARVDEVRV